MSSTSLCQAFQLRAPSLEGVITGRWSPQLHRPQGLIAGLCPAVLLRGRFGVFVDVRDNLRFPMAPVALSDRRLICSGWGIPTARTQSRKYSAEDFAAVGLTCRPQ